MADSPPGSGIPIIGPILQDLAALFGAGDSIRALAAQTERVEENVWSNAISEGSYIFGEAGKIWDHLKGIFQDIGTALADFWTKHLKGILDKIIGAIKKVHDKLNKILKPLQKWLQRIRNFYINHILKWELLAIQIISAVRLWLTLLRLLHVKWAAQLDKDLQKIQGYITDTITPVVSTLNEISTILGLAIDPLGFISKSFMLGSLTNSLADVKKAAGYGSARLVFPDEKAQEKATSNAMHGTQPLSTPGPGGAIVYDPALQLLNDQMTGQVQAYGYTP
jgi:hypothetical protein